MVCSGLTLCISAFLVADRFTVGDEKILLPGPIAEGEADNAAAVLIVVASE